MRFIRQTVKAILLFVTIIAVSGCEGLPDNIVREIENMSGRLDKLQDDIDKREKEFIGLSSHEDAKFLQYYAENETWEQFFSNAKEQLKQATTLYEKEIAVLYDEDDPKDASQAIKLTKQFKNQLQKVEASARYVSQRITFLTESRDNAAAIQTKATQSLAEISRLKLILSEKSQKAITDHPNKTDDLNAKQLQLGELENKAKSSLSQLNLEFEKRNSSSEFVNYATIGDQSRNIEQQLKTAGELYVDTKNKISQLYESYVRVLADQRVDYYIIVRRASWCEGEYCGNGSEKSYQPVPVDAKVFEYFDSSQTPTIATLRRSWGSESFKVKVQKDMWDALSIDKKYRWNRGHDQADYWVNKIYTNTFHKYVEIKNDESKETGWVSVKEDFFWKQYENLGMAIISKPYGLYDEDAMTDAQPVGLATVAKPVVKDGVASGSNQYGEWRQSNGLSFWHYYGMYSMFGRLIGPSRYGYNDWYGYSNRRRGFSYYGRENRWGTFGRSTYTNSRYQNSGFARKNASAVYSARTGKSASGSRSVRGASSSNRNRGPSSRGK